MSYLSPFLLVISSILACTFSFEQMAHAGTLESTALIRSDYRPGEIGRLCDSALEAARQEIDTLKKKPFLSQWWIKNSLLAFETAMADFSDRVEPLTFLSNVSTDAGLRAESTACEEKVGQFLPTLFVDPALYHTLKRGIPFSSAERRLRSETLREFEKNGMALSSDKLSTLKNLKQKLATLQTQFSQNLNNDVSTVTFSKDELSGVPKNFVDRISHQDGKFVVTTKSTDFIQVMENASNLQTRRRMLFAYLNRGGAENTKLMEEAIRLRSEIAKLLGFSNWADLQIEGRMAKTSKIALRFLEGLREKLKQRAKMDIEKLAEFKRSIHPDATSVEAADLPYLSAQLKKKNFSLDEEVIAEYFPLDSVIDGLFDTYSTLFGVRFVEVRNAPVWATGVKLYEIHESKTGEIKSYFYQDTVPRPGKYGHAAAFSLISGRKTSSAEKDGYSKPVSAIVANFTPPSVNRPSLLKHEEVETLFHEFGHIMHQTLTSAPYASLSGSSVAHDFVEAPSQMLENWVWNKDVLRKISKHFKSGEKIPESLMNQMISAKDFNQGLTTMRQLLFGLFDLKIHSSGGGVDVTSTYNDMYRDLFGIPVLEGTHFPAGFGHLMGGYDAGYYGYLWSEVYAQDMFSRFETDGLFNSQTGAKYRQAILEMGNMRDAIDLLSDFLGRSPRPDAFYRLLGITEPK
ncbi:MAG: Zn-dependent oligopeptidase [Cryobacterium sp.]|nr:Zn-dependent oligopeptidase [Oligoflexia bacterium]